LLLLNHKIVNNLFNIVFQLLHAFFKIDEGVLFLIVHEYLHVHIFIFFYQNFSLLDILFFNINKVHIVFFVEPLLFISTLLVILLLLYEKSVSV